MQIYSYIRLFQSSENIGLNFTSLQSLLGTFTWKKSKEPIHHPHLFDRPGMFTVHGAGRALALLGHDGYRPGQRSLVEGLARGDNVFAALPTGSGKSCLFQLPAVAMAKEGTARTTAKVILVLSPFVALSKNQIGTICDTLGHHGVTAHLLSGGTTTAAAEDNRLALNALAASGSCSLSGKPAVTIVFLTAEVCVPCG